MAALFESADGAVAVFDTNKWVEANKSRFVPPVCNKCLFDDQLKVFFVGGPNIRKDYHLEEGEEIFFQIKGDIVLKVVEKGMRKDIQIREGEIFLLPAYVEHSPQRPADSLGCVVERERSPNEKDCVRYFVDESDNPSVLWERWFHLNDVVTDLPPVFQEFAQSEESKTGQSGAGSFTSNAPYEPKPATLKPPVNLHKYIDEHLEEINKSPHFLFGGETRAQAILYGNGTHDIETGQTELVLLFQRGEGELVYGTERAVVKAFFTTRIGANKAVTLKIANGVCLAAKISPK